MSLSKTRERELRAMMGEISKELKLAPGDLVLGQDIPDIRPRTSTGILALDAALGGGLPLDQWIEVVGPYSSGKTATTMQIIAHQQRVDPDWICLWVAAEGFEKEFAVMNGVDVNRLIIVETNAMEEVFETIIKWVEKRAIDGIVIDSYPALVPIGEYEREMIDGQVPAIGARLFNQFFRKVQKASRRSLIEEDRHWLGIVINQWRDTIGVMFGDTRTTPGGKGKDYSYYVRLDLGVEEKLYNNEKGRAKHKVGQQVRVKIFKNKSGPPERTAYYDLYVVDFDGFKAGDIDLTKDVFLTAEALSVLTREEGKNAYYFMGEKIGGNKPRALDRFDADPDLVERVQAEVYAELVRKYRPQGVPTELAPESEPKPTKKAAKKSTAKKTATKKTAAKKATKKVVRK